MSTLALHAGTERPYKGPFLRRLKEGFQDKESRRYFMVYLVGKMIGLMAVIALAYVFMKFIGDKALAQDADTPAPLTGDDIVNPLEHRLGAGHGLPGVLHAGRLHDAGGRVRRSRETVNVLQECIVDTCLCGLLFWAFGFAFMFGEGQRVDRPQLLLPAERHGHLRHDGRRLPGVFLFQFAFAGHLLDHHLGLPWSGAPASRATCSTASASAASSTRSSATGSGVGSGGGRLGHDGHAVRDFAGSTVVHTIAAWSPWPAPSPRSTPRPQVQAGRWRHVAGSRHDHRRRRWRHPVVRLYGFNPGSTLSAMDFEGIGRVATNTTLAACAGGLVAMAWVYPKLRKWDVASPSTGSWEGSSPITCPCYWVDPLSAIIIGGSGRRRGVPGHQLHRVAPNR